ncbi:McrB family protein [Helicobacter labetoulli]|uniref:McrB family protein n=1 Tax=Helicobacter labetoulli TaxID=2315333 RepID=UPI001FC9F961|nr:AAA family ATPase [Helicobacter labetoulli]
MDKIEWSKEERELFQNALRELKKQVDECLARNQLTQRGQISAKDTSSLEIKPLLAFLNADIFYKISIGNQGGCLNPHSWIAFVRKDIVRAGFINTEKFSVQNGVCLFIAYQGYFDNNPHFVLKFGFPDKGGIELARCRAVNTMEQSKALERYFYTYPADTLDYEKITDDFLEAMNYFNTFSSNDFIAINPQISDNDISQPQAQQIESIPLNQILYGLPGTGKTYHTIDKALEILFARKEIDSIPQERDEKKKIFNDFISDEQIAFVTFHQSYGYEDFVEGIRPRLNRQKSDTMEYEIKDGIFKDMCQKASENYENYEKSLKNPREVMQEIELDDLLEQYAAYIEDELEEGKEPKFESKEWTTKMKIQGIHRLQNGDFSSIIIGVLEDSSSMQRLTQKVIKRDYEKFKNGEIKDWNDIKPSYESKSHRHGNAGYYFTLYESIAEFEKTHYQVSTIPTLESTLDNRLKPYILIIDEINRGNISKILGELITLLEPSKRKGEKEALEVTLPYSQELFSVPKNLYIIGTMNTADRSIALLDTALRRRFEFIEMLPDSNELQKIWLVEEYENKQTSIDDYDTDKAEILKKILDSINSRIKFLLDRERTIGHSFFFEKAKLFSNDENEWYELTLTNLKAVFKNKILPLLQEYFYDDYAKINAVLNNNGMLKPITMSQAGISLSDEFVDNEKQIWEITDSSEWDINTFKAMYKNTESN